MSKKIKRIFVLSLVFCMILTQMVTANTAFAAVNINKITGLDKYETAVKVSQSGWTTSKYVVLAYGEDFPDALCSAPLAKKYDAPILLTPTNTLPTTVINEILRLGATNIMIVGGEGVISKSIEDYLKNNGKTVTRLWGADRYETSLAVANHIGDTSQVVLAYAENYPDALSISSIAAAHGMPILLTDITSMPAKVKTFIGNKKVFVVGGTGVISDAVVSGLNAERLSGMDRYETNAAILRRFSDLNFSKAFLATGLDYTYALIASPLAALTYSPVILADNPMVTETKSIISEKVKDGTNVLSIGNVSDVVLGSISGGVIDGGTSQDLKITSITPLVQSGRVVRIQFNKQVPAFTSSDVTVTNKASGQLVGVYDVLFATNGMSANVEFIEDTSNAQYLEEGETYTFTIRINENTISYDYARSSAATGRVINVDKDEEEIEVLDENEDTEWYSVPSNLKIDYQEVLGLQINLSLDDNEIINYSTSSDKVKHDAVEIDVDEMTATLISEDDEYNISDNLIFRINGQIEDDEDELDGEYDYAKIVLDSRNNIVFMDLYDWENFLVVEDVDDYVIYSYDNEIDVEDFTIVKSGKTIDYKAVKAGDIVFYNEDAEFAEVYNKTVEDEIEDVTEVDFTFDGEEYTYEINNDYDTEMILYLNRNRLEYFDSDAALDMEDEEVTLYFDRAGNAIFVNAGDISSSSASLIAYVVNDTRSTSTRNGYVWTLDVVDENGDYTEYDVDEDDIDDDDFFTAPRGLDWEDIVAGTLVGITLDKDDNLVEVEFLEEVIVDNDQNGEVCFEAGDRYVDDYRLNADTVMFNVEKFDEDDDYDEDDNPIDISLFEDINYDEIIRCRVFVDDGDDVLAVIVEESDRSGSVYTEEYTVVLDSNPTKLSNEDTWRLKVWLDGELKNLRTEKNEGTLRGISLYAGDVVEISVDEDTEEIIDVYELNYLIEDAEVESVTRSSSKIQIDGVTYTLEDDAIIYDISDIDNIEEISLRDIDDGDIVTLYLVSSGSKFVRAVVVTDRN
ncbi:N-acetylmuramoyl-L-alanine amidase LytC precursor [Oxobacter pfennigii]|uniref:N-acetylmuramoyl-L-alanine amidase LytC n=1 Tax=Oxobacter pfennigii TaxID=36849 RepID=A0A0P9AEF6_9CLOT|nr:cell wall-binding repeat-containing protein [Oxobacter pfennigii]KPU43699.1 N-acetylmuramoyl-L-alanine amidase LytC precursor [Oxobacter pfennigii]